MNTILTVIVAGGSGLRMGSSTPKQFLELDNKPIVMHTITRMAEAVESWIAEVDAQLLITRGLLTTTTETAEQTINNAPNCVNNSVDKIVNNPQITHRIVLVLPADHISTWRDLCTQHNFATPHTIAPGGATRFHSVQHGLTTAADSTIVLIHDGVRPLVSNKTVSMAINSALDHGAAIPVVELTDSLRYIDHDTSRAVERALFRAVQTPQVFRSDILQKAYAAPYSNSFTDDASVVEHAGYTVELTPGEITNIKITTPIDLIIARELIHAR